MPSSLYDITLHLTTIGVVYLAIILIIKVGKKYALKVHFDTVRFRNSLRSKNEPIDDGERTKQIIDFIAEVSYRIVSSIAVICVIVAFLFLYRPTERRNGEIGKVKSLTVDRSSQESSIHSIDESNKKILETKREEVETKAEKENSKAIEDVFKLFESKEIEK